MSADDVRISDWSSDVCSSDLMDAPGIREELRDMARRLATVGYLVLLPNLYYRAGRDSTFGPDVLAAGSPDHTRMRAIRTKMTIPPVMDDIAAMLAFVDARDDARPGPVGVHGYCMSGPYALAAAARFPDREIGRHTSELQSLMRTSYAVLSL